MHENQAKRARRLAVICSLQAVTLPFQTAWPILRDDIPATKQKDCKRKAGHSVAEESSRWYTARDESESGGRRGVSEEVGRSAGA